MLCLSAGFVRWTNRPSALCSTTAVQLHSDFGSLCVQNGTEMFVFYCDKITREAAGSGERVESVWCEVFSVENCIRKDM
jgi:hypothetical protein